MADELKFMFQTNILITVIERQRYGFQQFSCMFVFIFWFAQCAMHTQTCIGQEFPFTSIASMESLSEYSVQESLIFIANSV